MDKADHSKRTEKAMSALRAAIRKGNADDIASRIADLIDAKGK